MTGTDHTGKAGSGGELHMQTQGWTTPKVQDERHGSLSPSEMKRHTPTLAAEVHTFPTPTAKDADGSRDTSGRPGSKRNKGRTLTDATADLWPTPRTLSGGPESAERKKELGREDPGGDDLQAAAESWPSPRAEDSESCGNHPGAQDSLTGATTNWPTPKGSDVKGADLARKENRTGRRHSGDDLSAIAETWPTPVANPEAPNKNSNQVNSPASLGAAADQWPTPSADGSAGEDSPDLARKGAKLVNTKTGRVLQTNLATEAKIWPTPAVPNGGRTMSEENVRAKGATVNGKRQVDLGAAATHWPTPNASLMNDGESPESFQARADRLEAKHENTNGAGIPLPVAAAAWPTPRADSKGGSRTPNGDPAKDGKILDQVAKNWATPTSSDLSTPREQTDGGRSLMSDVASWPTPAARDHKGANSEKHVTETGTGRKHMDQLANFVEHALPSSCQSSRPVPVMSVHGGELSPTDLSTASRRRLNPAFVCWLMGWPWWWTNPGAINSARQATESYLFRLRTLLQSLLRGQD